MKFKEFITYLDMAIYSEGMNRCFKPDQRTKGFKRARNKAIRQLCKQMTLFLSDEDFIRAQQDINYNCQDKCGEQTNSV